MSNETVNNTAGQKIKECKITFGQAFCVLNNTEKTAQIWDEYKYRHDLIWKHLIRSTLAVIALITVQYSSTLTVSNDPLLVIIAPILAVAYILFTWRVVEKEIKLYSQIKVLHRLGQSINYNLHYNFEDISMSQTINLCAKPTNGVVKIEKELRGSFSLRVRTYIFALFIISIIFAIENFLRTTKCASIIYYLNKLI